MAGEVEQQARASRGAGIDGPSRRCELEATGARGAADASLAPGRDERDLTAARRGNTSLRAARDARRVAGVPK